jgi:FlaA1/EpsC-like NDP-sugar epimerase
MNRTSFRNVSRRLVVELAAVALLVGIVHTHFPKGGSYAESWRFVVTHPLLLLHVAVSILILTEASLLQVRSLRSRNRSWTILAFAGLAFTLVTFVSGERFVATQLDTAISVMDVGFFGALATYGLGWRLSRRKPTTAPTGP